MSTLLVEDLSLMSSFSVGQNNNLKGGDGEEIIHSGGMR